MNKCFLIVCIFLLVIGKQPCLALHKIAVEGMPGAGKTTTLLELIAEFDQCILFPELHPEPENEFGEYCENCEGDIYHQMQITRMHLINKLPKEIEAVLLDRSFYSNHAYQFAINLNHHNSKYENYAQLFHRSFNNEQLDLIIFLDAKPETGLLRRGIRGDEIPEPWNDIRFLTEFRNFYLDELPKMTDTPIIHIITDNLSPHEVKAKVKYELQKWIPLCQETKIIEKEEKKVIDFANKYDLGEHHSQTVNVLGYPTIYFRQHGVVLFEGKPIFFSNQGLKKIIDKVISLS